MVQVRASLLTQPLRHHCHVSQHYADGFDLTQSPEDKNHLLSGGLNAVATNYRSYFIRLAHSGYPLMKGKLGTSRTASIHVPYTVIQILHCLTRLSIVYCILFAGGYMRDNNKRRAPLTDVLNTAMLGALKDTCTSIPGYVVAFDAATQRAQVQIGIVRVDVDGTIFNIPPIVDVPVSFPGDDYVLEYQISPGCEGDIVFSQRCMDAWKQTGGIAANPVARFHNKQDAKFIPGIRSLTNAIANFANNGVRIRNATGDRYFWIKNDGTAVIKNGNATTTYGTDGSITNANNTGHYNLLANGNVNINGVIIDTNGKITPPAGGGVASRSGVLLDTHRHDETGSITGAPRA